MVYSLGPSIISDMSSIGSLLPSSHLLFPVAHLAASVAVSSELAKEDGEKREGTC